jgi:hypothetical protein
MRHGVYNKAIGDIDLSLRFITVVPSSPAPKFLRQNFLLHIPHHLIPRLFECLSQCA